jgi:hypothetical protein
MSPVRNLLSAWLDPDGQLQQRLLSPQQGLILRYTFNSSDARAPVAVVLERNITSLPLVGSAASPLGFLIKLYLDTTSGALIESQHDSVTDALLGSRVLQNAASCD